MEKLRTYINSLPPAERAAFAAACGTTVGYLRKVISTQKSLGESICIGIERETNRLIKCEELRPDVDWATLRCTCASKT